MTIDLPREILEKLIIKARISGLTPERYLEKLVAQDVSDRPTIQRPFDYRKIYGCLEGPDVSVSKEEIDEARREMWANFPREFPNVDQS